MRLGRQRAVVASVLTLAGTLVLGVSLAGPQEAAETFGCEANPTGDPIGGGDGYRDILTAGDFTVTDADGLVAALAAAQPGQVIFVPDGAEIDLTEQAVLSIPGGVTLAGTRGRDGSVGARIYSTRMDCRMFVTAGDRVRLTGLRFEGPYGGTERLDEVSDFIGIGTCGTEIDNCEIYNFSKRGVLCWATAMEVYVHHNFIHHCQGAGLGYGVSVSSGDVRVIANIFDHCRHCIASAGRPGAGYEAAWNLVLSHATGHNFDVHGGGDRGDGTHIAGDWIDIHHNTFQDTQPHVMIRGVPSQGARIHHNWFAGPARDKVSSGGNTQVYRNVYGPDRTLEE